LSRFFGKLINWRKGGKEERRKAKGKKTKEQSSKTKE
jgi:hypothetical protein